jgi:CHAT domain-containing protein
LPAELVVLSACQSGLGRHVNGEGLIGFTRALLHAGARATLVSLWRVDDQATADLMKRFYYQLLKKGLPAPAALRAAQLEMAGPKSEWRDPYFWAGFVLHGDWQ